MPAARLRKALSKMPPMVFAQTFPLVCREILGRFSPRNQRSLYFGASFSLVIFFQSFLLDIRHQLPVST